MLRRFARIVRWQDVVPAGDGGAEDSTHGQLTEQNAHPRARFLATVPEEPEDDKEPAGGHGECREVREGSVGQWPKGGEQMLQVAIDR